MAGRKKKGGPCKAICGRRVNDRLKEQVGAEKVWCEKRDQWRHVVVCLDGCFVTTQRKCATLQKALAQLGLPTECAPPRKRRNRKRETAGTWSTAR